MRGYNRLIDRTAVSLMICLITLVATSCGGSMSSNSNKASDKVQQEEVVIYQNIVELPTNDNQYQDTIHLGRMSEGEIASNSFTLHNKTEKPIVIIRVEAACGCSNAELDFKPLLAGEKRVINFKFDSSQRWGYQLKYFDIVTADDKKIRVYFDAEVRDR